jgi:hypothetical protein
MNSIRMHSALWIVRTAQPIEPSYDAQPKAGRRSLPGEAGLLYLPQKQAAEQQGPSARATTYLHYRGTARRIAVSSTTRN